MKLALVLVSLLGLFSHASADTAQTAARHHVAAARALHAQQRYQEALAQLEAAYAIDPKPSLLFALGQVHVQLGQCARALVFYRRFLASRPKPDDAAVAREAIEVCKASPPRAARSIPILIAPVSLLVAGMLGAAAITAGPIILVVHRRELGPAQGRAALTSRMPF